MITKLFLRIERVLSLSLFLLRQIKNAKFAHSLVFLFAFHAHKSGVAACSFGGALYEIAVSANIRKNPAFADILREAAQKTAGCFALLPSCHNI